MKDYRLFSILTLIVCLLGVNISASAADMVWQNSEADAVSLAKSQGKKILLFAGRETCGNCQYMKYTVSESESPPIRSLIEQHFIPWFCPVDTSDEWYAYASGLGSFSLPMICVIDPNDSGKYLDRTTGVQSAQVFYSRLLQYASRYPQFFKTRVQKFRR